MGHMGLWGGGKRPDHCYTFPNFLTLEKLFLIEFVRGGGALTLNVWRYKTMFRNNNSV